MKQVKGTEFKLGSSVNCVVNTNELEIIVLANEGNERELLMRGETLIKPKVTAHMLTFIGNLLLYSTVTSATP